MLRISKPELEKEAAQIEGAILSLQHSIEQLNWIVANKHRCLSRITEDNRPVFSARVNFPPMFTEKDAADICAKCSEKGHSPIRQDIYLTQQLESVRGLIQLY